ncbi:sodium-coupled monocarboxylate transporter 1 [Folsomia candida]|uniref:sodium-coupled monocarboxylate transporter 1 n=1 Tax=Folsomia candida TaxID=158441 RepID=UPI001604D340|nr:sodium-coupled monocarboxylate transporter 1 [Folsomia candida]
MGGVNYFGILDYLAVAGTLTLSLGVGLYYACAGKKQTNEDMLVGGRNMSPVPIAASMLVTYLSAITILGYPAEVYVHGIQIYMLTIMPCIYIPLATQVFVKVFYEMKLTSVYEYLELRFESVTVRWLASFTFIVQVLLINGVVLFAPAIALEAILGIPVWQSVVGIGVIGTVYTSMGGIKAVVWTDSFQFIMIAVGLISIMVRGFSTAGGISEAFRIAGDGGRLVLFDFTFDPFMRHNFWNFFFGYGFANMTLYGTHQPQVQRYCSLPSVGHAIKALLLTIPMKFFTMTLVLCTGISVFATYSGCDPILLGKINKADAIIPHFVVNELSFIPGLMGIFVSCIFSAVLSTVSSTLNSLAAVTWEDFLSKINFFRTLSGTGQANCVRIIAAFYGLVSIGLAFGAQYLGQIFQATMTALGATAGPLGGVFICALFIPWMNKYGAIGGMVVGLTSMMYLAVQAFLLGKQYPNLNLPLHTSLDQCPAGTDFSFAKNSTFLPPPEWEWPTKIYTISYILYPIVGAIITAVVGMIVSILTGGCCSGGNVPRKYLHPVVRSFSENTGETTQGIGRNIIFLNSPPPSQRPETSRGDKFPYKYDKVSSHAV